MTAAQPFVGVSKNALYRIDPHADVTLVGRDSKVSLLSSSHSREVILAGVLLQIGLDKLTKLAEIRANDRRAAIRWSLEERPLPHRSSSFWKLVGRDSKVSLLSSSHSREVILAGVLLQIGIDKLVSSVS
jgi:hypothetical protein